MAAKKKTTTAKKGKRAAKKGGSRSSTAKKICPYGTRPAFHPVTKKAYKTAGQCMPAPRAAKAAAANAPAKKVCPHGIRPAFNPVTKKAYKTAGQCMPAPRAAKAAPAAAAAMAASAPTRGPIIEEPDSASPKAMMGPLMLGYDSMFGKSASATRGQMMESLKKHTPTPWKYKLD
jgi:hypothetical protein